MTKPTLKLAASPLLGSAEPRLFTAPERGLTPATTDGFEFIEWWRKVLATPDFGPPLPWQEWLAHHILELKPDGTYRHRTAVVTVARQNGKTAFLVALGLWRMHERRHQVLGAAQNLDTAREALQRAQYLSEDAPALAAATEKILTANGKESIVLGSRAQWRIAAANRRAGRGKTIDLLILDELREQTDYDAWSALSKTITTRPNGQIIGISNAGEDDSVVLNDLRARALAGGPDAPAIFEWSAPEGCALDDPDGWRMANPSLGHLFDETAIRSSLATDPPAKFRTEVLCQRVDVLEGAVDTDAWRSCADPAATLDDVRDRVVVALDVAPDMSHATLVAAAPVGDRVHVEVVRAWQNMNDLRADLPDLIERVNPVRFGWFPGGPAAALVADLRDIRRAQELKSADVAAACQGLAEQVSARRITHPDDPLLNAQVTGAKRLAVGDGWRFTRRGGGTADALYAVAGAVHLARLAPPPLSVEIILPD